MNHQDTLIERGWLCVDGDHWMHLDMEMVYTFEQACRMEGLNETMCTC